MKAIAKAASVMKAADYLKPENRPDGYYKIKYGYGEAVALWLKGHWCFCGDTRGFSDSSLEITSIYRIEL